eukprot:TRINITY_DN61083_c0_g1_i1.p1 TRINITY_DN61083_c0_g1~~TRINITY_DN61083_c0_g1_i1.p1  ORF type:complete len:1016 (-),score=368.39 TRINITY_DN61083_c0_g1_i1:49-3096(-)
MTRKKIDNRIRLLIENGVAQGRRSMFVVVGDKARDQVVFLHHMLSKATVKARPSVLWCYKKELGFSSHRKKKMKQLNKKIKAGKMEIDEENPFEMFVASTNIRYSYYHETHKILGNTYGMCVLQDFEALTPNLLARTVETVEGGGAIILLINSVKSLKQLYTITMDVHSRYRTEAHQDVVNRFNERFILSLASNHAAVFLDDSLNILPLSNHIKSLEKVTSGSNISDREEELVELKSSLQDTQPIGALVNQARTLDQAKALLKFVEAISEKTLRSTVSLTAARGRGKSAALGLAIAAAVGFGYSNIFVTSPSPENLHTLFDFVFKGFDALNYEEHLDYELIQSTNPEFNKAVVRVNIFHDHRQTIQYIHPGDAAKLSQAELVVIDEAAAIPLPLVKSLLGPYLVFMASTINGYEGTGRSLSLKLLEQLRQQSVTVAKPDGQTTAALTGRSLHEVELKESIRYRSGDKCESWLNGLLCLEASCPNLGGGTPLPQDCSLYYINRDTLFSYHSASESFLHRVMALFVSSHYKNSPNDLQLLSDAPAHHLFCLLGPLSSTSSSLPEVLCVMQVCLEGEISRGSIMAGLQRGQRASGDLIPWTMAQQFQDDNFPQLSGARVVRIATHPEYQRMGYGSRALQLLQDYYQGKIVGVREEMEEETIDQVEEEELGLLEESLAPRKNLPPLLLELGERPPEALHYLGTSFGLTPSLLRFWKKAGYVPTYLRQTKNDLTGEHTTIMLKLLDSTSNNTTWLTAFWTDFRRRLVNLLGYQLSALPPSLALSLLHNKAAETPSTTLSATLLSAHLTPYDVKRLELYSNNMADHHLVTDLVPVLAKLVLTRQLGELHLSAVQLAILAGQGLQHKTVDQLTAELELPASQLLALFNRSIRKLSSVLRGIMEGGIEEKLTAVESGLVDKVAGLPSLGVELSDAAIELEAKQKAEAKELFVNKNLSEYVIKGSETEWNQALQGGKASLVSVKTGEKRPVEGDGELDVPEKTKKKKKDNKENRVKKKHKEKQK